MRRVLRAIDKGLIFLFVLLLAYWVSVRALFMWVEYAPKQVEQVVKWASDSQINYQNLTVKQTLLGAQVEIKQFQLNQPKLYLGFHRLSFDFNFLAPFIYQVAYGEHFELEKGELLFKPGLASKSSLSSRLSPAQLWQNLRQQVFHSSLKNIWSVVDIRHFSIGQMGHQAFYLTLHSLKSFRSDKWHQVSDFSLFYHQKTLARINLRSQFKLSSLGYLKQGNFHVDVLSPIETAEANSFLPLVWRQKLPNGQATFSLKGVLFKNQTTLMTGKFNLNELKWPYQTPGLPNSLGFKMVTQLDLKRWTSKEVNGSFLLTHMRINHQFTQDLKPIKLSLNAMGQLDFATKSFGLSAINPMLKALWPSQVVLKDLSIKNLKGQININTAEVDYLTLSVPRFKLNETKNWPGLVISHLKINKINHWWHFETPDAIQLQSKMLRAQPVQIKLNADGFNLHAIEKGLKTQKQQSLWIDQVPIQLKGHYDFDGHYALLTHLKATKIQQIKALLPYPLMSKSTQNWLKAGLVSGQNITAILDSKGRIQDFPFKGKKSSKGYFKVQAMVKKAEVKFQPDWPAVHSDQVQLDFTPFDLKIRAKKAQIQQIQLNQVQVAINHLASDNIAVNIQGRAEGQLNHAFKFLKQTPLAHKIGLTQLLSQVKGQGKVKVDFPKIWIPVLGFDQREEEVIGQVQLVNNQIQFFNQIPVKHISGQFNFTEKGVTATQITGQFLQGPVSLKIKTQQHQVQLTLKGQAQFKYQKLLTGPVPWVGQVNVPIHSKQPVKMNFKAEFNKLHSSLPKPFDQHFFKVKTQPLKVHIQLGDQTLLHAQFFKKGQLDVTMINQKVMPKVQSFNLWWGERNSPKVKQGGHAFIALNQINYESWLNAWHQYQSLPQSHSVQLTLPKLNWRYSQLDIKDFILNKNHYPHLKVNWHTNVKNNHLQWLVTSPNKINFLVDQNQVNKKTNYQVKLSLFKYQTHHLKKKKPIKLTEQQVQKQAHLCQQKPSIVLPNLTFSGQKIQIDDVFLNTVSFNIINTPKWIKVEKIRIGIKKMQGNLQGHYQYDKKQRSSQGSMYLHSNSVEGLTHLFKIKKGFTGEKGTVTAQVQWPGGIRCFSKHTLKGQVSFKAQKGMIKDADAGLAKLLSLLSIESFARRLDLSSVKGADTGKGLLYNEIKGTASLNRGKMTIKKMTLTAPAAEAELFGHIDYLNQTMNVDVNITPQIGSSVATIVAITGIASPIASLATYLILKAVPQVNEDLVTYRYEVRGPIDHLRIKDKGLGLDPIKQRKSSDIEDDILNQ